MPRYKVRIVMDWSDTIEVDDNTDADIEALNKAIESGEWWAEVEELDEEEQI